MNMNDDNLYDRALELKKAGNIKESIEEFKRIIKEHGESGAAMGMIANLFCYELDDPISALPYAKRSIELSPRSEMASICLVHCLFHFGKQDEIDDEIRRYIKTGSKIDLYKTLFEENGLVIEDFIEP